MKSTDKWITHEYKTAWSGRNRKIAKLLHDSRFRGSILDLGCGDKDVLRYLRPKQQPTEYLGLDRVPPADIIIDFNTQTYAPPKVYDLGLVLGVLEYLEDPWNFLEHYKQYANRWIILTSYSQRKPNKGLKATWKQRILPMDDTENFQKVFKNVSQTINKSSIIWSCS